MKWYGIKMNGVPMGFYTEVNDGDFSCDIEYSLEPRSENIWLVPNRERAEKAMVTNTIWYNADYDSPRNEYVGKNLEVFEVEIS